MTKSSDRERQFVERVSEMLSVKAGLVTSLLRNRPTKAVRLNSVMGMSAQELATQLSRHNIDARPLAWYPDAFLFPSRQTDAVSQLPAVVEGYAFLQNPSSFLPIFALEPRVGDRYLDVCAAPGGKAALFAGLADDGAWLWLNDNNKLRLLKLRDVLRRLNVRPNRITDFDARRLTVSLGETETGFDKVLLDAECSTEAGVNFESRNPLAGWSLGRIEELSHIQIKFAIQAYDTLKPGGIMVYSTCTFAPEENEHVISSLLQQRPGAIIQTLKLGSEATTNGLQDWRGTVYRKDVTRALRIKPSDYMEGFFLCRIVKPTADKERNALFAERVIDLTNVALAYAQKA